MNQDVSSVLLGVLGAAITLIVVAAGKYLSEKVRGGIPQFVEAVKADLGPDKWSTLISCAELAIRTAQQLRLTEQIEDAGKAAKAYAIEACKRYLIANDLEELAGNVDLIADVIEGIYQVVKDSLYDAVPELNNVAEEATETTTAIADKSAPQWYPMGATPKSTPLAG